jgi:hypothetical protein
MNNDYDKCICFDDYDDYNCPEYDEHCRYNERMYERMKKPNNFFKCAGATTCLGTSMFLFNSFITKPINFRHALCKTGKSKILWLMIGYTAYRDMKRTPDTPFF